MKHKRKKSKTILTAIFLILFMALVLLYLNRVFLGTSLIFYKNFKNNVKISFDKNGQLYWPIENQSLVVVSNSPQINFLMSCGSVSNINTFTDSFNKNMNNLIYDLNNFLDFVGMKDVKDINFKHDEKYGTILGYKGDDLCQLIYSNFCFGDSKDGGMKISGSFVCSEINSFEESKNDQIDILINLAGSGNAISNIEKYGDFYGVNLGSPIGPGYYVIAKKEGSKWTEITSGQDSPACSTLIKYNVPSQISYASECYDENDKIIKYTN